MKIKILILFTMIIQDFQPLAFEDCTFGKCQECGVDKCDLLGLFTDYFSFQFNNVMAWDDMGGNYPTIDIVDCNGNVIDQINDADYYVNESIVQVVGNWSDYVTVEGCYRFIIRGVEIVINGTFDTNLDDWVDSGADWEWDAGVAKIPAGNYTSSVLTQTFSKPVCLQDDVNLTLNAVAGDIDFTDVYVNGILHTTVNGAGNKSVTIVSGTTLTSIGFSISNFNTANRCSLDDVSILKDYRTRPTCIYTEAPVCTVSFEAWNNVNMTNIDFESDTTRQFKLYARLQAEIINPRYPTEEEIYLSSAGNNTLNYARSEKVWDLNFARISEMTWDALTTIFMCYYLYFDGDRFIKLPGDIEPNWQKSNKYLATGSVQVKKQTENRKK